MPDILLSHVYKYSTTDSDISKFYSFRDMMNKSDLKSSRAFQIYTRHKYEKCQNVNIFQIMNFATYLFISFLFLIKISRLDSCRFSYTGDSFTSNLFLFPAKGEEKRGRVRNDHCAQSAWRTRELTVPRRSTRFDGKRSKFLVHLANSSKHRESHFASNASR